MSTEGHCAHSLLEAHIQSLLPSAQLKLSALCFNSAVSHELKLWLIDPEGMNAPLNAEETRAIFANPPYWSFCWGSGLALAERLLRGVYPVKGKTVLDFGCGASPPDDRDIDLYET